MIFGSNLLKTLTNDEELEMMKNLYANGKLHQILKNTGLNANAIIKTDLSILDPVQEESEVIAAMDRDVREREKTKNEMQTSTKRKHKRPEYFQVSQKIQKITHPPAPPPIPYLNTNLSPFETFLKSIAISKWKPFGKIVVNIRFLEQVQLWTFKCINQKYLPKNNKNYFLESSNKNKKHLWTCGMNELENWYGFQKMCKSLFSKIHFCCQISSSSME